MKQIPDRKEMRGRNNIENVVRRKIEALPEKNSIARMTAQIL